MVSTPSATRFILILKTDRLYAETLGQLALSAVPQVRVQIASSANDAAGIVSRERVDLLLTGMGSSHDGDALDLVWRRTTSKARRVLVVTSRRDDRTLTALRALEVDGVFDSATENSSQFAVVVRAVINGNKYWSQSLLSCMQRDSLGANSIFRRLTGFEQLVLAILGDGRDDDSAARELQLSPSTIGTVRREIHRKLGVQHRGDLVRVAAQSGFVRFTPEGVARPGFSLLNAAYDRTRKRPVEMRHPPRSAGDSK